jgi:hypothetical protein
MPTVLAERLDMLPAALAGDEEAARGYARAWRSLVAGLLHDHSDAPASAATVLEHVAVTAPFDPDGPLHALVSVAEGIIGPVTPPPTTAALALPSVVDYERFARAVLTELAGAGTGLERLMAAWRLTVTDVAELFGVRRQAVQQWLAGGVPASRAPKLSAVLRTADLLERNLLAERIPGIVRTPAAAYGGTSMLVMITDDRHDELLELVARSFDWAATA